MTPYSSIEQADEYFSTRLNTEYWDDLSDETKFKALCTATRAIDRLRFKGTKYLSTQENKFPRTIDETFLSLTIPSWLIEATCEVAINLVDGTDMEQEMENLFATNQSYATVSTGYNSDVVPEWMRAGIPSAVAWNLLKPYLVNPRELSISRG